jgi:crotonobetainyl-CoA:carnitine CoA-transferase CaiB-like acyl-CoA transferase
MAGALDGITILDFTRFQQGTFATVLLADMGANVWKLEPPGGDPGRRFLLQADGFSTYFESLNRNKRSIVLDLRKPDAREAVFRMAEHADAVVENFRQGVMDRLGIGYDELAKRNPRLIYAAGSTFGPKGPRASDPGHDGIAQAAGGIMMDTRRGDEQPMSVQGGLADQVGGMMLSHGILAALLARERTGKGQRIDTSLYGSQLALQGIRYSAKLYPVPPAPRGSGGGVFGHRAFCADAVWISFGYLTADFWPKLCKALDLEWLMTDPRFAEPPERAKNEAELVEIMDAQVALRPSHEWIKQMVAADLPCSVIQDYAMIAEDPQALENEYVLEYDHPRVGRLHVQGFQTSMSDTPAGFRAPAPLDAGLHGPEILREAGLSEQEIAALIDSGALKLPEPRASEPAAAG